MDNSVPEAFIFMKVGDYGSECLEGILFHKNCELEGAENMIFWGYGGTVLHPKNQVQPFVKQWIEKQKHVEVLMSRTNSSFTSDSLEYRKEYSENQENWETIPSQIISNTKYALVLDEIRPCHFDLDLRDFKVGVGPSKGKNTAQYIKGQVDKGCFVRANPRDTGTDAPTACSRVRKGHACISYRARLKHPYAVFLR